MIRCWCWEQCRFQCRTQHCVCRDGKRLSLGSLLTQFQCRTQHCVCRDNFFQIRNTPPQRFNAARSIVCVETHAEWEAPVPPASFQCRTQHCVCRDFEIAYGCRTIKRFQCRTQHCVCRDQKDRTFCPPAIVVSMPHAALCVSRQGVDGAGGSIYCVSMPHAALCVSRHCVPQPLSRAG